ncbi:hypothetical protein HanXRQr2_Chr10g0457251 [Helianthus annuus]|uniref:Uncharacterized protein n=1 Tax=Helianthus annuus TaxID=4232 RepID=A0A9K3I0R1_HELAN|nr:hypothetical protein HanXRQr2_Chr10g0457251 [Helianthus annuus]KAJ0930495.1 hypothetical protein HanPSC8_Chr04g0149971 [Helianthus annuus]
MCVDRPGTKKNKGSPLFSPIRQIDKGKSMFTSCMNVSRRGQA